MFKEDLYNQKMTKTFDVFVKELASLRTGRANASMLDLIKVDVYGQKMPINQLATITTPEPRVINIQVWDANNVSATEKAIRSANLGLNPAAEGNLIRVPMPKLSEERRAELVRLCADYAEKSKIAIRNARRDILDIVKKQQKDSEISEDEAKSYSNKVQDITNEYVKNIEDSHKAKQDEIMEV